MESCPCAGLPLGTDFRVANLEGEKIGVAHRHDVLAIGEGHGERSRFSALEIAPAMIPSKNAWEPRKAPKNDLGALRALTYSKLSESATHDVALP